MDRDAFYRRFFRRATIDLSIPGMIDKAGLRGIIEIARQVPKHGTVIETGSLYGRSSFVWAKNVHPSARIICIDPWIREQWIIDRVEKPQKATLPFGFEAFLQHTRGCHNIIPLRGNSPDIVQNIWCSPIDVYFDDSVHQEPYLSRNYDFWVRFVKPGGIVGGDDYMDRHPDVVRYADALSKSWNQTLKRAGNVWWLTKPL
jgi:hypothetical protein